MDMIVIVNGKEEVREVDHLEVQPRGQMARQVPVLRPGERLIEAVGGKPYIVKDHQQ
jgi:hypothetical protein